MSAVSAILLLGLSVPALALVSSSGAAAALNSVQVTILTTANLPYQYTLTAYNTSGYQVADFYGSYPEAAFGLPSGTYLITASAYYQASSSCNPCLLGAGANGTSMPIIYKSPSSEYGYAVVKVTAPVQMTIATENDTGLPVVDVPVHVAFFNGTAAGGAYVSAYVVGMSYGYNQRWVTGGQTGSDGNFTLVMPDQPIQVTAYLSLPVALPKNVTTVPVEVGGQKVNVTVYWQPMQVGLVGQALILPPQKGADITLKVQQYPYPVYFSGPGPIQDGVAAVTVTSTATGASQQASPSAQPSMISPFHPTPEQLSSSAQAAPTPASNPTAMLPAILGAGAVAVAALVAAMVLVWRKHAPQSARP